MLYVIMGKKSVTVLIILLQFKIYKMMIKYHLNRYKKKTFI